MRSISHLTEDIAACRHHIHTHPETVLEEYPATQCIIDKLTGFGITELYTNWRPQCGSGFPWPATSTLNWFKGGY